MAAGVHEDVQRGVGAAEVVAVEDPEEGGTGEQAAQPLLLRATSDDHQRVAGVVRQVAQEVELLLGRQTTDVADEQPAVGGELSTQVGGAPHRVERLEVDAARPQGGARDREVAQLREAGRGGRQGAVDLGVDAARQRRHRPAATGHVVALGEADQIGLVDRDRRDPQALRGLRRLVAQRRRRGDVHDVGREALHDRAQPAPGLEPDAEVGVERQVGATGVQHREPGVRRRAGGRDQRGVVPGGGEVLEHPAHGVGDSVDLGQERLGDDEDAEAVGAGGGGPGQLDQVGHGSDARSAAATPADRCVAGA